MRSFLFILLLLFSTSISADLKDFADDSLEGTEEKKKKHPPVNINPDNDTEEEDDDEKNGCGFSLNLCGDDNDDEQDEFGKKDVEDDTLFEFVDVYEINQEGKWEKTRKLVIKNKKENNSDKQDYYENTEVKSEELPDEGEELETYNCCIPLLNTDYNVYYLQYPYGKNRNNLTYESGPENQTSGKDFLFCAANEYGYYFDEGKGFSLQLDFYTRSLGAEVGYEYIQDENSDFLSYFNFGLNFILYMNRYLEFDFTAGYVNTSGVMVLDGYSFGFHCQFFPIKPLVLEGELSYHIFTNRYPDIKFVNYDIRCGIMMRRAELFLGHESRISENSRLSQIYLGHKWFF